ncbi:MAG: 50S ribosomal protein L9 [Nitrospirae bacterium]|nr:MAG: 50S ribosomal protein L9 [Nitrospirota bacterium]
MKVILQETIENLGYVGDILDVADGYARNYLIPRKKALIADPRNIKALEHAKRLTAQKAKKVEVTLQAIADKLAGVTLTFPVQTGKDDKLFGSVTAKDLEEGLRAQGFDIDRRKIQLPQPIKELGTRPVSIKLHRDIVATITVAVVKKEDSSSGESSVGEAAAASSASPAPESSLSSPSPKDANQEA